MDATTSDLSETNLVKEQKWYKQITVEPTMFLYMLAFSLTSVVEQSFYVYQACRVNHNYSLELCYNITQYPDVNTEVQVTVTWFHQWNGIIAYLLPMILAFFIGSYSDKRGRKLILLVGLIGKLYFSFLIILNIIREWPVEYIIYTASLPCSLTGADLTIFTCCYAYIADVSSVKNRTLRVSLLTIVYSSTVPLGVVLGNLLYTKVLNKSFTVMFTINTSLMVAALLYSTICLKARTSSDQRSMREASVKNPITDFFDLQNIKNTIVTLVKRRPTNGRAFLWILLISIALHTFAKDERRMMYLYTTVVFKWDTWSFSNFRTFQSMAFVLGMMVGIPLMSKVFNWKDTIIVMVGSLALVLGHVTYAQATQGYMFFIGATVAALGSCVSPLIKSMTSKVLLSSERGVAFAFLSVMENFFGLFSSIIYSRLYGATLNTKFMNSIFYFTLITQAVVFLFAAIIHLMLKGQSLESIAEEEEVLS